MADTPRASPEPLELRDWHSEGAALYQSVVNPGGGLTSLVGLAPSRERPPHTRTWSSTSGLVHGGFVADPKQEQRPGALFTVILSEVEESTVNEPNRPSR